MESYNKNLTPYHSTGSRLGNMTMNEQAPITIGVLAKRANVGTETIRFYERKGIITQPPKSGGFRYYSEDDIKRIRLIKKAQEIGFTLEEIKDFLMLDTCTSDARQVIQQKAGHKIQEVEQKIADLTNVVSALKKFLDACGTDTPDACESDARKSNACEIVECFENDWECCNKSS